jgi:hypothetical protein
MNNAQSSNVINLLVLNHHENVLSGWFDIGSVFLWRDFN